MKLTKSANSVKFTEKALRPIPPHTGKGNETVYWDTELTGLGLAVSKHRKTFFVRQVIKGMKTKAGQPLCRRIMLGTYGDGPGDISLDQAKTEAFKLIADMRKGVDPVAEREKATRERAEQERREREQAERAKQSQVTLRDTLEGYLRDTDLRESTKRGYRYAIERNLAKHLDSPIASITRDDMLEVRQAIKDRAQKTDTYDELAGNGAVGLTFRTMKALFNYEMGKESSAVLTNPLAPLQRQNRRLVKAPPLRERTRYLEEHERAAFYEAIVALGENHQDGKIARRGDPVLRDYFLLLLFTGFRRSEAAGLQWSEVNFRNDTITLPPERTKNKKALVIPMSDYLRQVLHTRWEETGKHEAGFVFPAHSTSGHVEEPRFYLDRACARAGITETLTIHDLRRTFVNVAEFEVGIPMSAAKALINHTPSSSDVTLTHYVNGARNNPTRLRPAMQKIADKLKRDCGISQGEKVVQLKQRA